MRLVVTGGGTGGHVYPALSALEAMTPAPEALLWIGKEGGMERELLARADVPYRAIRAGGLADTPWGARLRHSMMLVQGFGEAWHVLRGFNPDVVFATGGYVTVPVGLAAWMQRIPLVVYLPDLKPGMAVRTLGPMATKVGVTVPESRHFFGKKAVVTGYPVRKALATPKSKAAARAALGIPANERLLLVTGGSSGSHSLNEAVGSNLAALLDLGHVLHIHGKVDGEWLAAQVAALSPTQQARYHLHAYLHETMSDALLGADLVVARAGASVLGEFTAAALPSILVPLPAAGVQQEDNARWLAARGAAVVVADSTIRQELVSVVRDLFTTPGRLDAMASASRAAAHPDASRRLADLVQSVAAVAPQPAAESS